MKKGRGGEQVPLQAAKKRIPAHGAEESPNPRQMKRRDAIDMKHANRRGVVGEEQRAAFTRSPPLAFLSVGQLPVQEIQSNVGVEQPCLIPSGLRAGGQARIVVYSIDGVLYRRRILRARWRVLILAAQVDDPATGGGPSGESCDAIEALLKRPSKVVVNRLAKMIAIRKRRPGNICNAHVDGFEMDRTIAAAREQRQLGTKLLAQRIVQLDGHRSGAGVLQPVGSFGNHSGAFEPGPGTYAEDPVGDHAGSNQSVK